MTRSRTFLLVIIAMLLLAAGCSSSNSASSASDEQTDPPPAAADTDADPAGIRLVSAAEGAVVQADPPADLVILDVRTPEEFAEGHLEGAILVDFYDEDFADQLADLDTDVPYLMYCRSGNRSGQAAAIMADLGFTDVADVDGGILAWDSAGGPITNG